VAFVRSLTGSTDISKNTAFRLIAGILSTSIEIITYNFIIYTTRGRAAGLRSASIKIIAIYVSMFASSGGIT
jgi:hypothetical protein